MTRPLELKQRILIIRIHRLSHLPPGLYGTEILSESGYPCTVFEMGEGTSTHRKMGDLETYSFNPFWLKLTGPLRPIALCITSTVLLILSIILKGRPCLIIAHGLFEQVVAFFVSRICWIPYGVHVHEIYDASDLSPINRLFFLLDGYSLRHARFLIFPGEERRNIYVNRYGLTTTQRLAIHIVSNCPRLRSQNEASPHPGSTYRDRLGLSKGDWLMTYIGGVGQTNAIVEGVIATARVPGLHFVVAGWIDPAYRAQIDDAARSYGVTDRIHLIGKVKDDKWPLLAASDVTLCVYKPLALRLTCNATASNKLMESLAVGTPVIGGTSSDFKAFFERYKIGEFTPSPEPELIATAVSRLLNDRKAYDQMRERARELHLHLLNYEKQFAAVIPSVARFASPTHTPASARRPPSRL